MPQRVGPDREKYYTIGEVADMLSMGVDAIRHYEKWGLIKPAKKAKSGYRYYSSGDIIKLLSLKQCRDIDMSISDIKSTLVNQTWDQHHAYMTNKKAEVQREIARLTQLSEDIDGRIKLGNRIHKTVGVVDDSVLPSVYRLPILGEASPSTPSPDKEQRDSWVKSLSGKRIMLMFDADISPDAVDEPLPLELYVSVSANEVERTGVHLSEYAVYERGGKGLQYCLYTHDVFSLTARDVMPLTEYIRAHQIKTNERYTVHVHFCEYRDGQPNYLVAVRIKVI